jgi:hypothetical protein
VKLEEICAALDNITTPSNLWSIFPQDLPLKFSIPSGIQGCLPALADPNFGKALSGIIASRQNALEQITLVGAWAGHHSLVEQLNKDWQGVYAVQELVLGTKEPDFYKAWPGRNPWRSVKALKNDLYGYHCLEDRGMWGNKLQRLRIDHTDCTDINMDEISQDDFTNVRVLMFHAQLTKNGPVELPPYQESSPEWRLANEISAHTPPLRVLVVGPHWFWLERNGAAGPPVRKIWPFQCAQGDYQQGAEIEKSLPNRDWSFLMDSRVPRYDEQPHKEWRRASPAEPSCWVFSLWNYIGLLPEVVKDDKG